jgi:putative SOS response-associated peptidase YedK
MCVKDIVCSSLGCILCLCFQRKIREKIELEELESEKKAAVSTLKLTKLERYLHGPTPVVATSVETTESLIEASQSALQEMESWKSSLTQVRCLPVSSWEQVQS